MRTMALWATGRWRRLVDDNDDNDEDDNDNDDDDYSDGRLMKTTTRLRWWRREL